MLAREKRFAVRSIAVGIVGTGLVAAFCTWQVRQADARLEALKQKPPPKVLHDRDFLPPPPPGVVFEKADPPDFVPDKGTARLSDISASDDVDKAEADLNQARDSRWFLSLITFAAFCLPLVWYFFLDRLREISGALSGRDKDSR